MGFQLTEEQHAAVYDRGGGTLVSAAAGSGKTRVLVERLLARVEEEGADIDRFLVITYTNAAASELRGRIAQELSERLARRPGDRHLRRQATLVYKAQISTVHAFCMVLLRECGHLADLDPDFRLCDEQESGLLMLRALNDVLDRRYEDIQPGSDFAQLVDTMSAGRDDQRLVQIVLDVRGRVQSHPDPAAWLREQADAFALEGVEDAGATPWGVLLLADAAEQAGYWRRRLAEALELAEWEPNLAANYGESLRATRAGLSAFLEGAALGWDAARAALPIPFPPAGRKKVEDKEAAERLKAIRSACKDRMEKLEAWFTDGSAGLLEDLRAVHPAIRGLFALVADFEAAYTAEKKRRNLVDFSDLEHLAAKLLTGPDGAPTPLARQWAGRYEEIMVDEYQDTNAVQNAIFTAVSRGGNNLFLVGDVKQSIYRFRLADPTIFLKKYRAFRPYTEAAEGEERRIILSKNFRSRPQVLEGANYLFRSLMSEQFGEMDYTADEALYPGAAFPEEGAERYAVELDALDLSALGEGEEEKPASYLLEARFAARRIRQLVEEGFPIVDGGESRPARYGDVVILLRSPGTVFHHYARALGELDIPWEADGGGDFFAATEVQVALSLLEILDNPRQDVPLISALRSPVYAFSADQLARIRAGAREGDFYAAVEQAARAGDADCARFLSELSALRFGAVDRSCWQLVWDLYDRTNLLGVFGAMDEGERRQANLLALAELARKFEGAGHKGLFGFLSYLAKLRENGANLAPPQAVRTGGGVRILSIHKSKGLEFPIVFLCGLSRRLNREDMNRPILFHPDLGVGPKRLDTERMVEYPTLARRAVARKLEYEMTAEELRLLYVAVTRAKEKLILTCALARGGGELKKLAGDAGSPVAPQALAACSSVGQWVLLAALARPDAGALRAAADTPVPTPAADFGPAWDIRWVDGSDFAQAPRRPALTKEQAEELVRPDPALLERLCWHYPHAGAVEVPSKLTATQLKGRWVDEEVAQEADSGPERPQPRDQPLQFRRPRFAAEELGLTPAQRGTALHLAMQFIDFSRTGSVEEIREELQRLAAQELITPQQGEAVDPERLFAFFSSPLGREVLAAPTLRREFKFSILVDAADYYPQAGEGEQVLLQGVVDCFFETLEGITVVDFKTDRVSRDTMAARAEEYRPQLAAYARALAEVTGKPVARQVLWFFRADGAVEL